jgi:UDP-N-acetylglucosamine 2-epimerase (non-hydrolysing)
VLVFRKTTERPEGVSAGVARVIGTECESLVEAVHELLSDRAVYDSMARAVSPYGDGHASVRIADVLADWLEGHR